MVSDSINIFKGNLLLPKPPNSAGITMNSNIIISVSLPYSNVLDYIFVFMIEHKNVWHVVSEGIGYI